MRLTSIACVGVGMLVTARSVHAGPLVTYDFTGTVTKVTDSSTFALHGAISAGTSVTGSFTYDPGVAGFVTGNPNVSVHPGAAIKFSVNIGGGLLVWDSLQLNHDSDVVVANDATAPDFDEFLLTGGEVPPSGLVLPPGATIAEPFVLTVAELFLIDPTLTALADQSIPTSLDISAFSKRGLLLWGGTAPQTGGGVIDPGMILTTIDTLTRETSAVPEPSTLVISSILIGVFGGVAAVRRTPK